MSDPARVLITFPSQSSSDLDEKCHEIADQFGTFAGATTRIVDATHSQRYVEYQCPVDKAESAKAALVAAGFSVVLSFPANEEQPTS